MKKNRLCISILIIVFCAVLICIGGFVLTEESEKVLSGICIGIGAGIFGGVGLPMLLSSLMPRINPKWARAQEIEKRDERNISICNASKAKAFDFMGIINGSAVVITVIRDKDWEIVSLFGLCYLVMFIVHIFYLQKYSKTM